MRRKEEKREERGETRGEGTNLEMGYSALL